MVCVIQNGIREPINVHRVGYIFMHVREDVRESFVRRRTVVSEVSFLGGEGEKLWRGWMRIEFLLSFFFLVLMLNKNVW